MGEILLSRLDLPGLFDFFLAGRNLVEYLLLIISQRMNTNRSDYFIWNGMWREDRCAGLQLPGKGLCGGLGLLLDGLTQRTADCWKATCWMSKWSGVYGTNAAKWSKVAWKQKEIALGIGVEILLRKQKIVTHSPTRRGMPWINYSFKYRLILSC